MENKENDSVGIKLNKKTLIGVTALLFAIMIFAGALTKIIPAGEFDTTADGSVIPGTYHQLSAEEVNYPLWRSLIAPFEVFTTPDSLAGVGIIAFIILIGGTFLILDKTGILKYIMTTMVEKFSKQKYILLPVMALICMLMGSVCGMLDECVTLVPLACAISLALGWDSMVGFGFSLVAIAFGYGAATFNPFNVSLIQTMAGLPMFSGLGFRIAVFIAIYAVLTAYLLIYAKKIEKHPEKSVSFKSDMELREKYLSESSNEVLKNPLLGKATRTFVTCICSVFVITAISFYFQQRIENADIVTILGYVPMVAMAVLFTAGGVIAGSQAGLKGKKLLQSFTSGVKTIAPVMPLILFILAITYILKRGKIIDTILNSIYTIIQDFTPVQCLLAIFVVVIVMEFFIGSGTAKAFLMMPLILPLTQMLTVSHQSVIVSFCLADGICNVLYPTSGMLIIGIGLINVSYPKYLKWAWKLFVPALLVCAVMIVLSVKTGY